MVIPCKVIVPVVKLFNLTVMTWLEPLLAPVQVGRFDPVSMHR